MRTKTLSIVVWAVLVLTLPMRAVSQSGYADSVKAIKSELKNYQAQLESIEREMISFTDCDRLSDDYLRCTTQMDVFYNENRSFITLQSQILYDMWMDIMVLRKAIDEKMEILQQEAKGAGVGPRLGDGIRFDGPPVRPTHGHIPTTSPDEAEGCQRHSCCLEEQGYGSLSGLCHPENPT